MDLFLSASESRLLRHLALADIPYTDDDTIALAVRGLDEEEVRDDARSLAWRGMVTAEADRLSITPLGAAAYYAFEVEQLTVRLSDVCALVDELERAAPALARQTRAVRQVAQGAWTLEEATRYTSADQPGPPG
ncbi:hypothetical protein [Streptomyces sp. NPDC127098]|uniref:hypothetical protein n=1 Tax=Streptomyces sp. NPDC127098 TaxID=3347137 RepID=UPI003665ACDC